jgi:hypothetical protein
MAFEHCSSFLWRYAHEQVGEGRRDGGKRERADETRRKLATEATTDRQGRYYS